MNYNTGIYNLDQYQWYIVDLAMSKLLKGENPQM